MPGWVHGAVVAVWYVGHLRRLRRSGGLAAFLRWHLLELGLLWLSGIPVAAVVLAYWPLALASGGSFADMIVLALVLLAAAPPLMILAHIPALWLLRRRIPDWPGLPEALRRSMLALGGMLLPLGAVRALVAAAPLLAPAPEAPTAGEPVVPAAVEATAFPRREGDPLLVLTLRSELLELRRPMEAVLRTGGPRAVPLAVVPGPATWTFLGAVPGADLGKLLLQVRAGPGPGRPGEASFTFPVTVRESRQVLEATDAQLLAPPPDAAVWITLRALLPLRRVEVCLPPDAGPPDCRAATPPSAAGDVGAPHFLRTFAMRLPLSPERWTALHRRLRFADTAELAVELRARPDPARVPGELAVPGSRDDGWVVRTTTLKVRAP